MNCYTGLKVNTEKTKYIVVFCHQNVGQNYSLPIINASCENVAKFKCLRTTITNKNGIHKEIKRKLGTGNAYYCSAFLSPLQKLTD